MTYLQTPAVTPMIDSHPDPEHIIYPECSPTRVVQAYRWTGQCWQYWQRRTGMWVRSGSFRFADETHVLPWDYIEVTYDSTWAEPEGI